MTTASWVRPAVVKEFRALLPVWLVCVSTIGFLALLRAASVDVYMFALRTLVLSAVPICWIAPVAMGALSVGQEFGSGTLTALLMQPVRRDQVLVVKLGVLVVLLAMWAAVLVPMGQLRLLESDNAWLWFADRPLLIPALYGVCVAPWVTIRCRSSLAGVVLTCAVPAILYLVGSVAGLVHYGSARSEEQQVARVALAFLWLGTLTVSAVGVVLNWWTFTRLQAGGSGAARPLTWSGRENKVAAAKSRVGVGRRQHAVWLLVRKELALQQMAFVVAGLYVMAWLAMTGLSYAVPPSVWPPTEILTAVYWLIIGPLVGALASAEERRLGTLQWQALLPMTIRRQWAIKAGLVVGLTLALAVGVPWLLVRLWPHGTVNPYRAREPLLWAMVLSAAALYVSSLCANGLKAFLLSWPVALGGMLVTNTIGQVSFMVHRRWAPLDAIMMHILATKSLAWVQPLQREWAGVLPWAMFIPACALALRFARTNHNSAERGARRIWRQAAWISVSLAIGELVGATIYAL